MPEARLTDVSRPRDQDLSSLGYRQAAFRNREARDVNNCLILGELCMEVRRRVLIRVEYDLDTIDERDCRHEKLVLDPGAPADISAG